MHHILLPLQKTNERGQTVDDQMLIDSLDPNMDDKNPQDVTIINADADLEDLETRPSATDRVYPPCLSLRIMGIIGAAG